VLAAVLFAAACGSDDAGLEVVRADPATPTAETSATETTVPDETVPETTEPDATVPKETLPAETLPLETLPLETVPAETVPAETVPAETVPASVALPCPASDGSSSTEQSFPAPPEMCIDLTKSYTLTLDTSQGVITIELFPDRAPLTVNNIVYLARYHYFDNTVCHRVVPNFVVQCGDPTATGTGGPGYEFADELPTSGDYQLGSLAMANAGADTNGSQFFIISGADGVALPPLYTLFGQVTAGFEAVTAIDALGTADQAPSETVTIYSATVVEA